MSVLVTGVPTRNLANKKLNTRDEEPSGATYSSRANKYQLEQVN
jgi:hypothetical protein